MEKIPRDEPLIEKILSYLTTLWTLVIAPEVFDLRGPRDLNPFILTEPVESLDDFKPSLAVSVDTMESEDPTTHTSSALLGHTIRKAQRLTDDGFYADAKFRLQDKIITTQSVSFFGN